MGDNAVNGDDRLRQREARAYRRLLRRLGRVETAWTLLVLAAGVLAGARLASGLTASRPLAVDAATYLLGVGVVWELATLPFSITGYRLSRRVGLSSQGAASWLADRAKGLAIAYCIGVPALTALLWAQRRWPDGWWAPTAAAALTLGVVLTAIAPVVLLPLFFRSRALAPGGLHEDLLALARRSGVRIGSVRVLEASAKTTAANAFVTGIGPTRRIFLFDTLVGDEDTIDDGRLSETRAVLAHELGHHHAGDLWRGVAVGAVTTLVTLALTARILPHLPHALVHDGVGSFAALPALAAVYAILNLPAGLAASAYSRRRERAADAFGVRVGGDGEAFARAMERLVAGNLSELRPPFLTRLTSSHPAPDERIASARNAAGRKSYNGDERGVGESPPAIPSDRPAAT